MDLRELRLIVSRYLPIGFVVFGLCIAAGFATAFLPSDSFRTTATIVVDVNNDPEVNGGSVQQASFLLPAIEERAKSRALRERAANDVPDRLRGAKVTIATSSDASVLRIRGTSPNPEAAQAWVNAIADRLVEEQSPESPVVLGLLDTAPLKRESTAPNPRLVMGAFVVMGAIAALFSTLIADRIRKAFDTGQTVRDQLGTTVLGEVPALGRRERRRPIVALLGSSSPDRDLTAAFETIRANVEFRIAQVGADRVTVVSSGRTTNRGAVTAGLALTLANAGRRVVAIEADLRRPTLARHLGVQPSAGISDIAAFGLDRLELQSTSNPLLEVLPAGDPAGRGSDIVARTLPGIIDEISDGTRTVLVDCPPLRTAPESAVVVAQTQYVVLVIGKQSAEFSNLSDVVERITDAGGSLLGVVIDGVSRRRIRQHESMAVLNPPKSDSERRNGKRKISRSKSGNETADAIEGSSQR